MNKRIVDILETDTTSPVFQYAITCAVTYILSILLSVGLFIPQTEGSVQYGQMFCDCLVSTTVTLTASVLFQNYAAAAGTWAANHCLLTFLSGVVAISYMLVYLWARARAMPCLTVCTVLATILLCFLNLGSIIQVQKGVKRNVATGPKPGAHP